MYKIYSQNWCSLKSVERHRLKISEGTLNIKSKYEDIASAIHISEMLCTIFGDQYVVINLDTKKIVYVTGIKNETNN